METLLEIERLYKSAVGIWESGFSKDLKSRELYKINSQLRGLGVHVDIPDDKYHDIYFCFTSWLDELKEYIYD